MILERLAKNADIVARVEARDDDAVAMLVDEGRGKALIASAAGRAERVKADGMDGLDALFQAVLDGDEVFLERRAEFFQCIGAASQAHDRITDRIRILVRQEFFELCVEMYDIASEAKDDCSEDDEGDRVRVEGNIHVVDYSTSYRREA